MGQQDPAMEDEVKYRYYTVIQLYRRAFLQDNAQRYRYILSTYCSEQVITLPGSLDCMTIFTSTCHSFLEQKLCITPPQFPLPTKKNKFTSSIAHVIT